MRTAYFKHLPDDEQCQISFHLVNEQLRVDKVFNFNRNLTEQIDSSIERIRANVEKECGKKNKRKNKTKKLTAADQPAEDQLAQPDPEPKPVAVTIGTPNEKLTQITIAELLVRISEDPNVHLTVLENEFQIALNSPEVHSLALPSSILADFYVYPSKLELHFATKECSEFGWYRGLMPESKNAQQITWEEVGNELTYMVKKNDIGHHLKFKCTPKDGSGNNGAVAEIISVNPVQAGPGQCPFEVRHMFTRDKLTGSQFRVVSYNLLADLYSDSEYSRNILFGYCLPYALEIDYRKQLFIKEILGYKGDIICLQEVDGKIFDLDLVPIFQHKKYVGHYRSKGKVAEGLATFYDVDKFELLENDGVIISEILERYPELWEKIRDNQPLVERIANRSTALQLTVLRSRHNPKKHLLVANTHLYFHPDADHVRLLQFGFGMLYVQEQYDRLRREYALAATDLGLLFCGDFNSVPECGIYKLMTEGFVGPDFIDWESNKEEAVKNVSLAQPLAMDSACGCPKFTNYTVGFTECIDYIFYQKDVLRVNDVIPMPSEDELSMYRAIPSPVFPSDHIALVANLDWAS
ncbi:AGAP009079-PA-like protein [Anopheles sinensis]|uniref:2',5'-phosphodiesterase 12 n=1 Tax=Anopheles sinensis TaxID=74873 RepID=A0A084VNV8_ANOSI|nr:AGAP009079-PA-like protein [Anopheles sinensis]